MNALNTFPSLYRVAARNPAYPMEIAVNFPNTETAFVNFELNGFVFSEDTGHMTQEEFSHALLLLRQVRGALRLPQDEVDVPAACWKTGRADHFEFDASVRNYETSFDLLMAKKWSVIRKLRLYSQAFSGYQLAALRIADRGTPWIREVLPENYDTFMHLLAGTPDKWAMACIQVLMGLPEKMRLSLPPRFGEVGWLVNRQFIVNYDTLAYLCRVALLLEFGVLGEMQATARQHPLRALEIGGGFGGLAYMLMNFVPNMRYVIVDLPQSLAFSSIYLRTLFPHLQNELLCEDKVYEVPDTPGFTFCPPALLSKLKYAGVDFAVNTLSFAEMSLMQVVRYCRFLRERLAEDGVFFEQNNDFPDEKETGVHLVPAIRPFFSRAREVESEFVERRLYGVARFWQK